MAASLQGNLLVSDGHCFHHLRGHSHQNWYTPVSVPFSTSPFFHGCNFEPFLSFPGIFVVSMIHKEKNILIPCKHLYIKK